MDIADKLEEVASLLDSHRKSSKTKAANAGTGEYDAKTLVRMSIFMKSKEASYTNAFIEAAQRGAL